MILASFVNEAFLQDQASALLWAFTVGSMILLLVGADRAVSAAVKLAKAMGISTVIIGATVVSLGTTLPEACVSVMAAWGGGEKGAETALGNAVGSIIFDTAVVFGLCACLVRLPLDRFVLKRHGWLQLGAGAMLTAVIVLSALVRGDMDAAIIPRWVGVGFLVLLGAYMYVSFRWAKQHPEMIPDEATQEAKRADTSAVVALLGLLAVGLVMIIFGSEVLIGSVHELCIRYEVPNYIVAATVVAFGTSLPELATGVMAIVRGHPGLLVGNVVGADILNVLFVVGASSAATPLKVPGNFFYLHLPAMMLALVLLRVYVFTSRDRFSRWQGIPLLLLYVGFVIVSVAVGRAVGN
jgi:cation:H+ antiporter